MNNYLNLTLLTLISCCVHAMDQSPSNAGKEIESTEKPLSPTSVSLQVVSPQIEHTALSPQAEYFKLEPAPQASRTKQESKSGDKQKKRSYNSL